MINIQSIRINTDFRMSEQCVTPLQIARITSNFNGSARSFGIKITVEILFCVLKNIQNLRLKYSKYILQHVERERESLCLSSLLKHTCSIFFFSTISENIHVVDTAIIIEHVLYLKKSIQFKMFYDLSVIFNNFSIPSRAI